MTFGNAAAPKVRLIVWRKECSRQVEPDPGEMAERYGPETPVPRLARSPRVLGLRPRVGFVDWAADDDRGDKGDPPPLSDLSPNVLKLTSVVAVAATALALPSVLIVMDKRIAPVLLLFGIVLSAALAGCHAPGSYDPYASGIGRTVCGSRALGDQCFRWSGGQRRQKEPCP
jgi:hypothetical protein